MILQHNITMSGDYFLYIMHQASHYDGYTTLRVFVHIIIAVVRVIDLFIRIIQFVLFHAAFRVINSCIIHYGLLRKLKTSFPTKILFDSKILCPTVNNINNSVSNRFMLNASFPDVVVKHTVSRTTRHEG